LTSMPNAQSAMLNAHLNDQCLGVRKQIMKTALVGTAFCVSLAMTVSRCQRPRPSRNDRNCRSDFDTSERLVRPSAPAMLLSQRPRSST
jgi:hypothetical protein